MSLYRDDAVVLRSYKLGEADRIIVLYSRTRGKIKAVAKGIRRTRSKFGARLEPATLVHAQFFEGRNLDIVTQVETRQVHASFRSDLMRYGRAAIILEAVDAVSEEADASPALFKLVTGALKELDASGNPLIVPAFVAKLLKLEGVQPLLDRCAHCSRSEGLVAIDLSRGGVLCDECRSGGFISDDARAAMQFVFDGHVRHVLDTTTEHVADELETLSLVMLDQHLERKLRSSKVLFQHLHSGEPNQE